jgi:hypothetical protein
MPDPSHPSTLRRTLTFKVRLTPGERDVIRHRARGYANPAEYARRTLLAGWTYPLDAVDRVMRAFEPVQSLIDDARGMGLDAQADAATSALREILRAVGRP